MLPPPVTQKRALPLSQAFLPPSPSRHSRYPRFPSPQLALLVRGWRWAPAVCALCPGLVWDSSRFFPFYWVVFIRMCHDLPVFLLIKIWIISHFLALMNKTGERFLQVWLWAHVFILLGTISRNEWLGPVGSASADLWKLDCSTGPSRERTSVSAVVVNDKWFLRLF